MNISSRTILDRMKETKDTTEYKKLQAMHLYKIEKMSAKDVAKNIGTTKEIIYQWAHTLKKFGIEVVSEEMEIPEIGEPVPYFLKSSAGEV